MAGKIFVTGDCHTDFRKFNTGNFPEQRNLDKEDFVIICGDFGGIWDVGWESKNEKYWLKWLEDKSYTTLFVDGNHENFDRLNGYPVKEWHGGLVHEIRPSVLHLMRGQIFDIAGKKIFTFGGAQSHDVSGGILDPEDADFLEKKKEANKEWIPYRIKHLSWWEEELPSDIEYDTASKNLEAVGYKVDYIISHCCSTACQNIIAPNGEYKADSLTDFFDVIRNNCEFERWYFGHYHMDLTVSEKETLLYDMILPIGETIEDIAFIPGHPKYTCNDEVNFWWDNGAEKIRMSGTIGIVDKYGTFSRPDEPSYDIYAIFEGKESLFKHIPETDVIGYAD